jgi:hypothetical protein
VANRLVLLMIAVAIPAVTGQVMAADPPLKQIPRPLYKGLEKSLHDRRSAADRGTSIREERQLILNAPGWGKVEAVFPARQLVIKPHGGQCVALFCDWQRVRIEPPCTTESRTRLPRGKLCLVYFPSSRSKELPMAYFFYDSGNLVQVKSLP